MKYVICSTACLNDVTLRAMPIATYLAKWNKTEENLYFLTHAVSSSLTYTVTKLRDDVKRTDCSLI